MIVQTPKLTKFEFICSSVNLESMTSKIIRVYDEVFQLHIPFTVLPAQ